MDGRTDGLTHIVIIVRPKGREIALLLSCGCSCYVSRPRGAMGWSVVCDFGISWTYSLAFSVGLQLSE